MCASMGALKLQEEYYETIAKVRLKRYKRNPAIVKSGLKVSVFFSLNKNKEKNRYATPTGVSSNLL